MQKLLDDIMDIEFTTGSNLSFCLDKEFALISNHLKSNHTKFLQADFTYFSDKGRIYVLNTFGSNLLFLKKAEQIDKITVEARTESTDISFSVIFKSEARRKENTKYKPNTGKTESIGWDIKAIFPNFYSYKEIIQVAILIVLGKFIKRICEYGRTNFAYMKIENEFEIELLLDGEVKSKLCIELV